jgi:hypothetical protein
MFYNTRGSSEEQKEDDAGLVASDFVKNVTSKTVSDEVLKGVIMYENGVIQVGNKFYTGKKYDYENYTSVYIKQAHKSFLVHRLICYAFHPIPEFSKFEHYAKLQVNHKDMNKMNNHADNLEWMTAQENVRHGVMYSQYNCTPQIDEYKLNADGTRGEFVRTHKDIYHAARASELTIKLITKACKTKEQKYVWFQFHPDNSLSNTAHIDIDYLKDREECQYEIYEPEIMQEDKETSQPQPKRIKVKRKGVISSVIEL